MGYNDPDLYNQPEKFGIKIIGTVEWSEPCYSFDTTVVAEGVDPDGVIYYVFSDSGCSCPSPFESYTSLDNEGVWSTRNPHEVVAKLQAILADYSEEDQRGARPEVIDLTSKLLRNVNHPKALGGRS